MECPVKKTTENEGLMRSLHPRIYQQNSDEMVAMWLGMYEYQLGVSPSHCGKSRMKPYCTPLKTSMAPQKMMVGRQGFPIEMVPFQGT